MIKNYSKHFRSTGAIFSSSSDPKKTNLLFFKTFFFHKQTWYLSKNLEGTQNKDTKKAGNLWNSANSLDWRSVEDEDYSARSLWFYMQNKQIKLRHKNLLIFSIIFTVYDHKVWTAQVGYESCTSTQLVLSANSLVGPNYEACPVHQNVIFWNFHAQLLFSHVRYALPSW